MAEPIAEQVSVRLNPEQKALLDQCQERFPALPRGGLFIQLLYEWHWLREGGNNKSARLERIETHSKQTIEMLEIIIDRLGGNDEL